ncbi:undecaprenyl-diphosphatase [Croceicoccus sp. BE223]|nr:undecaprenyl-diphosphatase [Croceicoccus sp. BE223]
MLNRLRGRIASEFLPLLGLLVVMALAMGFGGLAGEMTEGETSTWDRAIQLALRHKDDLAVPIGPAFLKTAAIDLTALGSETILTLVTLIAVAFLLLRKRAHQAALLAVAVGGGAIVSGLLKNQFARPRPDIVPHLVDASSGSFPSGHAMNSAIVYLTIAVLVARGYEERSTRVFIVVLALLATLTIGATRVYLGVHWPSDMIAGWLVGCAWALAMGLVGLVLQKRRKIEPPAAAHGEAAPKPVRPTLH